MSVLLGYAIFALSAVLLFQLTHVDPHAPAGLGFMGFAVAYGVGFAHLAGFVAGRIGRRKDLVAGSAVAILIAFGATVSLLFSPRADAKWTQLATLLLFAPASFAGDWTRSKRFRFFRNRLASSSHRTPLDQDRRSGSS